MGSISNISKNEIRNMVGKVSFLSYLSGKVVAAYIKKIKLSKKDFIFILLIPRLVENRNF